MIPKFHNLVISSGSVYASSFIGCLKYLHDVHILQNVKTFVGTSAGAILCLMCVLDYTPDEIYTFMLNNIVGKKITSIDVTSIIKFCNSFGFDEGVELEEKIQNVLEFKGFPKDTTMVDLAKRKGKNLVVCVTNVTKGRAEYMSVDSAPDIPVVLAIKMSCSIPLVFQPVSYNGCLYLDGAITDGFPYAVCGSKLKETLCITASFKLPELVIDDDTNCLNVAYHVFNIFKNTHNSQPYKSNDVYSVIRVDFEVKDKTISSTSDLNLSLVKEDLDKYIELGFEATKRYFVNNLI